MNPADTQKYSPKNDRHLPYSYDTKTIENKKRNKTSFLGLKKENPFTILFLSDNVSVAEKKIFHQLVEGLSALSYVQLVLLDEDAKENTLYHHMPLSKKGYAFAVADVIVLFPSQIKSCFSELLMAMKYGTVPIVPEDQKTKHVIFPFDPVNEKGNGFLYHKTDIWNIFDAIIRAKENFRFPYDWENLIRASMEN